MALVDYFRKALAYDEVTGRTVADAEFEAFAITDTDFTTPLEIQDMQGVSSMTIRTGTSGVFPDFQVPGHTQIFARSGGPGGYVTPLTTIFGAVIEAGLAPEVVQGAIAAQGLAEEAARVAGKAAQDANDAADRAIEGSSGIAGAPAVWPQAFTPTDHTQSVATLRRGTGDALANIVLTLLNATNAQQARAAIGAGSSDLALGETAQSAMRGDKQFRANEVAFIPEGPISAATVQAAIIQAAGLGSGLPSGTVTSLEVGAELPGEVVPGQLFFVTEI